MNHNLCAIYLLLKRIHNYEPEIFNHIKGYLFYQFKSNKELRRVVSIIFHNQKKNNKQMIKMSRIRIEYINFYGPMSRLFQNMKLRNIRENCIKNWDISKVENMEEMFQNGILSQDLMCWDLSKVKNINRMFDKCIIQT